MFNARLREIDMYMDEIEFDFIDYIYQQNEEKLNEILVRLNKEKEISVRLAKDAREINKKILAIGMLNEKRAILLVLNDRHKAEQQETDTLDVGGHTLT